jgi:hypothetical protein
MDPSRWDIYRQRRSKLARYQIDWDACFFLIIVVWLRLFGR